LVLRDPHAADVTTEHPSDHHRTTSASGVLSPFFSVLRVDDLGDLTVAELLGDRGRVDRAAFTSSWSASLTSVPGSGSSSCAG
jgi:hypothetical protein